MVTNENIRVVQLTDDDGNKVSPVVNVGSLYDKSGNKVDNLLSYKLAGTSQTIPETKDLVKEVDEKLATAGHAIGDVVQNVIGPLDDTWLPCDGRIVDSSYLSLYNGMKIDSLYNSFDDISKWIKCDIGRFHSYNVIAHLYENSTNVITEGSSPTQIIRVGNVVYSTTTYSSYYKGCGYYDSSVSGIIISLDYGKTYKVFEINPNVKSPSSNRTNHVEIKVVPFKNGAYLIKSDGGQGELTIDVAVITSDTTALSFTRVYSYTQAINTGSSCGWLKVRYSAVVNDKLIIVWSKDLYTGSLTYFNVVSTTVYDYTTNTVNTSNNITNIAYNSQSKYDYIVGTAYDPVTGSVFIYTFNGGTYYTKLYKTTDFTSYTLVYDMSSLGSSCSNGNVAMMAYDNHVSIVGGISYTNYKGVQNIEINNGALFRNEVTTLGDGSVITDRHYIAVSIGGVFVYNDSTHTFERKSMQKYGDINEVSCIDDVVFVDTVSHGKVMFDMGNKRLPYIPGSYIKVK